MAVIVLLEGQYDCMGWFCRTCESLSAEALVVASRAVVQTDAFKKQSRTSERWLKILEVGLADLATYLQEQRAAGYTIIGKQCACCDCWWCRCRPTMCTGTLCLQQLPPSKCSLLLVGSQSPQWYCA